MRISPRNRKLLLIVHIAAAVGWLGAYAVLLALGVSGLRGAEPLSVYPAAHLVAVWVVAPLALVTLGTGLLQGVLTPWRLFRHGWVTIKLVLTVVMTVLVFVALTPGLADFAAAARSAAPIARPDQVQLVVAPSVASALLLAAITLSTFKPRLSR